ncbi:MAG: phosphoglycerate kinase [bacterium TMED264]|nr:MAG: phosphoglycerate kinase [bacterium TMED264]
MIKTLNAFDIKGKNILLRVDFNVPMDGTSVSNNFRIKTALPTINSCIEGGASLTIMSHLGRPNGSPSKNFSLIPVGEELAKLLEMPIKFSEDCISSDAIDTSTGLKPGEIHLLENLRFHSEEVENDKEFSKSLSRHGHIYINDAFGTAHRSHASNVGVTSFFKHFGIGSLMNKELNFLQRLMEKPSRDLTLIVGGAKVETKIKLIENFLHKADNIIIGGGMAFTFMKAMGKNIGGSLLEKSMIPVALNIINKARMKNINLILPIDVVCAKSIESQSIDGCYKIENIPKNVMGLDIGNETLKLFESVLSSSKTILWNGPMGVFERKQFSNGTEELGKVLSKIALEDAKVIVGGGDTVAALELFGLNRRMTHVSTGGGASLELLSGNSLPAIKSLEI